MGSRISFEVQPPIASKYSQAAMSQRDAGERTAEAHKCKAPELAWPDHTMGHNTPKAYRCSSPCFGKPRVEQVRFDCFSAYPVGLDSCPRVLPSLPLTA
jgi:hypothetical protein